MRLTKKNTAAYLTDKGFLEIEDLMSGDFVLSQSQSRNSIFQVSRGAKEGLFVKQLVAMDSQNVYLMQKDATVHYMIHSLEIFKTIKQFVPKYFGYDPQSHVLVTSYFSNANNLVEWSNAKKELSINHAVDIAEILSSFHMDLTTEIEKNTSLQFFNRQLPWILNSNNTSFLNNDTLSKIIDEDVFLNNQLDEIRMNWSGNSIIHGDIKLVNFIAVHEEGKEKIKLIDWEIANIGDPLWDVAGFLQSYLFFWVTNLIAGPNGFQLMAGQEYLDSVPRNKVTSIFWKTYVKKQGWTNKKATTAKIKTMKYTAARLLQSAVELNQMTPNKLSPNTYLILQIVKTILQSPEKSAQDYLGM